MPGSDGLGKNKWFQRGGKLWRASESAFRQASRSPRASAARARPSASRCCCLIFTGGCGLAAGHRRREVRRAVRVHHRFMLTLRPQHMEASSEILPEYSMRWATLSLGNQIGKGAHADPICGSAGGQLPRPRVCHGQQDQVHAFSEIRSKTGGMIWSRQEKQ